MTCATKEWLDGSKKKNRNVMVANSHFLRWNRVLNIPSISKFKCDLNIIHSFQKRSTVNSVFEPLARLQ